MKKQSTERGRGRPKLELGESFSVRLAVDDDELFDAEARKRGVGKSVYIRILLTEIAAQIRKENALTNPPPAKKKNLPNIG